MKYVLPLGLILLAFVFSLFSYLWVDLAIVLMVGETHHFMNNLYSVMEYGVANRPLLANVYLLMISIFLILQLLVLKFWQKDEKLLLVTAGITTFIFTISYPFLSHDFFTYLFFSHVAVSYHLNPYIVTPGQFALTDLWVGFVHSIDGTYRYGIIYLIYSIIPMIFIGGNSFLTNFFALKIVNGTVFFLTGLFLYKFVKSPKVFSLWFFNPILVVELLINSHNDLLMIVLFILSIITLNQKKRILSFGLLAASAGVKYISLFACPAIFLNQKWREVFFTILSIVLVIFLYFTSYPVQMWYYTWLYMFIPFIRLRNISLTLIYIAGFVALVNYSVFIRSNNWDSSPIISDPRLLINFILTVILLLELGKDGSMLRRLLE